MEDKQLQEILDDPKKLLNMARVFHQLLHLYDKQEMEKEIARQKGGTNECAGLGDKISILLTNADGQTKQELNSK
jgi:hypothetical protein